MQAQNVGINTPVPTKTLDINGDLRIRTLPAGTGADKLIVADASGNILKQTASVRTASIGDIKDSYATADHDGWYLLNGRSIASLSAAVQANAATLGFSTSLPDFAGSYAKTAATVEPLNTSGGSSTVSILKANLPQYNLNAVTNNPGDHTHSYEDTYTTANVYYADAAPADSGGAWNYYIYADHGSNTEAAGNHLHTFTLSSNGGNQAMGLSPAYIALKSFVYLGN
ncbi:hypothetical protein [Chryseobacterium soldanellicola]|uniref:hypothetical protein n=1 Tax=Chryseobacterium soldanellicola TaxID=311333 RepID=UPI001113319A|nr:hypothetical protein [Chryseobacterium soldanellicola]